MLGVLDHSLLQFLQGGLPFLDLFHDIEHGGHVSRETRISLLSGWKYNLEGATLETAELIEQPNEIYELYSNYLFDVVF